MSEKQLPVKNGVGASCVAVPNDKYADMTVLDYFSQRFKHVSRDAWQQRLLQGGVFNQAHQTVLQDAWIQDHAGKKLFYYREVSQEAAIPFEANIVYEDDQIVVADKPHFLPVIPSGKYVQETLLVRLRQQLDCPELTAVHRIDRETAGLVLLVKQASHRGAYQALFRERLVDKEYEAIAAWQPQLNLPMTHQSRLVESDDFFRMQEASGCANATTIVNVLEHNGVLARYHLKPITGKRHQLRVHMMALGMPILHDAFYPHAKAADAQDYAHPLQLLAKKMAFTDPISGKNRCFESNLSLLGLDAAILL